MKYNQIHTRNNSGLSGCELIGAFIYIHNQFNKVFTVEPPIVPLNNVVGFEYNV